MRAISLGPWALLCLLVCLQLATPSASASKLPTAARTQASAKPASATGEPTGSGDQLTEARLLAVYRLIASGRSREALEQAGKVVRDHPNFQLAQLVFGDLLAARIRPVRALGDVPADLATAGASALDELRAESQRWVQALNHPPRPGTIPSQFLEISQKTRHAVAVDASRSRLYLFENDPPVWP
jgi:hypothetical protein